MRAPLILGVGAALLAAGTVVALSRRPAPLPSPPFAAEMALAAQHFLAGLDPASRARAVYPLAHEERFNWHFVPRERNGLPLKEMTADQRIAAHALLRTALGSQGYLKASSIIYLESVLKALENGSDRRDPERYFFTVFGTPHPDSAWGWRVEGHHLSLNYTAASGVVSVTPAFLGANPAEVRSGPYTGLRVLGAEEDLARDLLASLDEAQRVRAILPVAAPGEIVTGNDRAARLEHFEGLPAAEMNAAQRVLLMRLVEEYVRNVHPDVAHAKLEKLRTGLDALHFAWAGSPEPGAPHYYRLHGPTVLFEYDNTQNDANHVHTVWRDLEDDFGEDLLRRHYETSDHHH